MASSWPVKVDDPGEFPGWGKMCKSTRPGTFMNLLLRDLKFPCNLYFNTSVRYYGVNN